MIGKQCVERSIFVLYCAAIVAVGFWAFTWSVDRVADLPMLMPP